MRAASRRQSETRALPGERRSGFGWAATHVLLPAVLLIVFGLAIVYVRLLNGPISLASVAGPIARSISGELSGLSVTVEDAIVRLTASNALEFRLRNVRVNDGDGQPLAVAPLAALSLSQTALWSGRLTPEHIVLIEPRLLLQITGDTSTSVSTTPTQPKAAPGAALSPDASLDQAALRQIEVGRALRQAVSTARTRRTATGFLKRIGLRQGTLILDHGTRRGQLQVLEASIELDHMKRRSTITGWAQFASSRGPWQIDLKAEEGEKEDHLAIALDIVDLVPAALAEVLPAGSPLAALDAPASGRLEARFVADGRIDALTAKIGIGAGNIRLAGGSRSAMPAGGSRGIESFSIDLAYKPGQRRVEVRPSTLVTGGSRIVLGGALDQPDTGGQWRIRLAATEGSLSPSVPGAPSLPLEALTIDGTVDPFDGRLEITRGLVRAAGAEIRGEASFPGFGDATPPRLDIRLGSMGHQVAKALWPALVAPGAREWIARRLTRGTLMGGTVRLVAVPGAEARFVVALDMTDVELSPLEGFALIEAPRVQLRLDGRVLDVSLPDAALVAGAQRRLGLKGGRFLVADVASDQPLGEISARVVGTLPATIAVLDRDPIALGQKSGGAFEGLDGKVDGPLRIVVPLERDVLLRDVQLDGKLRVTEARGKGSLGGYDIQAGSLSVDVSDAAVEIKGDLLVQGVAAKLSAQHFLKADADKPQPPVRLTATLDANDRTQLGLDVNHMITGEVPVEIVLARGKGDPLPRVRADLTAAALVIEPIAWVKPQGRSAVLTFDLGRGPKYKTELQNFKLIGDDIAVDGWMGLDAQHKLRELYLPEIALNLISRLEVAASLRQDNIWDVRIKGPTLDGRDIFRSLFSVGQVGGPAPAKTGKEAQGVDIRAEIDTLLGFSDLALKGVKLQASKRQDRLTALTLKGNVEGGRPLDIALQQGAGQPRTLVATSDDAGQVFRLIGFYPSVQGGRLRLQVNLDGRGPAEKTGLVQVQKFRLLGDPVVEVLSSKEDATNSNDGSQRRPRTVRQVVEFDTFQAPFAVGYGQFVIEDADLRGPLFGANLRGKADFRSRTVNLAGTYAPLQGLNAAIAVIPGIGQILAGPRGEGVFAITFVVQGPMADPNVLFNPFSLLTPGFLREITQLSNPSTQVTPTAERVPPPRRTPAVRASSTATDAPAAPRPSEGPPPAKPAVGGSWTSGTEPSPKPKRSP